MPDNLNPNRPNISVEQPAKRNRLDILKLDKDGCIPGFEEFLAKKHAAEEAEAEKNGITLVIWPE
jgi:hypothetical protein